MSATCVGVDSVVSLDDQIALKAGVGLLFWRDPRSHIHSEHCGIESLRLPLHTNDSQKCIQY